MFSPKRFLQQIVHKKVCSHHMMLKRICPWGGERESSLVGLLKMNKKFAEIFKKKNNTYALTALLYSSTCAHTGSNHYRIGEGDVAEMFSGLPKTSLTLNISVFFI